MFPNLVGAENIIASAQIKSSDVASFISFESSKYFFQAGFSSAALSSRNSFTFTSLTSAPFYSASSLAHFAIW